jgi:prophage regulatory protein
MKLKRPTKVDRLPVSPGEKAVEQPENRTAVAVSGARLLRRRAVETITGLSRSTIYARMNTGAFPAAIRLGGRSVGWIAEEIDAWIVARITESRPAGAGEGQP